MDDASRQAELHHLEQQAIAALQRGDDQAAMAAWTMVLQRAPRHVAALTQVGQGSFRRGDFQAARLAFQAAAAADGSIARQWVNVALACQQLGDEVGEAGALTEALTRDPLDLLALILRGNLYERQGRARKAASAYGAAATVAPPMDRLTPELRPAVAHAMRYRDEHAERFSRFVDDFLAADRSAVGERERKRFDLSLDILLGRKRRFDAQPMRFYVPGLPTIEFFDRSLFPWIESLEAQTADITAECREVLSRDQSGFVPYIGYRADQPLAQWVELNHSRRWSAFHLVKDGAPVEAHAARCPRTMAAWAQTPAPRQAGRTPVALFSMLQPKTRIPPHVGASNCRLVVHLPLIVPPDCGFRVGNETRQWTPGQAWVFDDTIEHEAWNDSAQPRVILIFDTWHPMLNPEERLLIERLNDALEAFGDDEDKDDGI